MHMHLYCYERITFAGVALHVWELSQGGACADAALRGGAASACAAGDAVHHPASAIAGWGGVTGAAWGNAGDGQHQPDADARDHGPQRLDLGAAWQRPARTPAASFPPGR